jgi:hypothetical protein
MPLIGWAAQTERERARDGIFDIPGFLLQRPALPRFPASGIGAQPKKEKIIPGLREVGAEVNNLAFFPYTLYPIPVTPLWQEDT